MYNLSGLALKFDGEYNDSFLYSGKLYLVDDETIAVIDFEKLIHSIAPENIDRRILFRYAFLNNSFFYKADNDFYEFFNMPAIRRILQSSFDKIGDTHINRADIEKHTIIRVKHDHPGILHFEVYKNSVFLSDDSGTFSYRILRDNKLMRKHQIFDFPAVHISAIIGDIVYFSCAQKGFYIAEFEFLKDRDRTLAERAIGRIDKQVICSELAYNDLILRDITDHFSYEFNTSWMGNINRRELSAEERVSSFEESPSNGILSDAKFVSSNANRLIKFSEKKIKLYKMDYDRRMGSEFQRSIFYDELDSWENVLGSVAENVYSGFQTVFGVVLDTDEGTIVVDDNPEGSSLIIRNISPGENVKVRHFYRSINYSHIIVSIKNESVEIHSDLTDYFFPRDKKRIRRHIPRRQALQSF